MSELAGRVISTGAQPVQAPLQSQSDPHSHQGVELHPADPNDTRPKLPHLHHHHNTPLESDPARQGLHDGTTYAAGAAGTPYEHDEMTGKPSVGQRIKEALPGTREHKAKKAAEGDLAVYT